MVAPAEVPVRAVKRVAQIPGGIIKFGQGIWSSVVKNEKPLIFGRGTVIGDSVQEIRRKNREVIR